MIKVEGLNKFYNKNKSNEIHVINDVTLELPSQGLVSFLGASGSGKTTLLNVIGGLDKGVGSLSYDSFEMKKYDMSRIDEFRNEHFGYVFQSYNLLMNETVYDNLKIALELIDIYDKGETDSRIEYALKSVGMYKYRKKRASQLSGGQQQRVAIARALVKHCKVIIADEPTGNLDSANAVEVMNILKSISRKTLVLLVTHNESLANFYSDTIYRIEDGKIIDKRENVTPSSLEATDDNVIYLKDMKLVETVSDSVSVKLYCDDEQSIELEIVERNNTFYLRSNRNIKLIESSNVKLVDDHYKPKEKEEITEYDYDDSFFNNSKEKRSIFEKFFTSLRRSFISFINPTKKTKAIYVSLALIGVLFSICAISISNAVKVDTSRISADNSYCTLNDFDYRYGIFDDSQVLTEALTAGEISHVRMIFFRYIDFLKKLNFVEEKRYGNSYKEICFDSEVNKLIHGRAPKGEEIAISRGIADELLGEFGEYYHTYEELFNILIENSDSKIVGIVDNPYRMVYVSETEYVKMATMGSYIEDDYYRYYGYEKRYDSYEVVAGRDLTDADFGTDNVLISEKYYNAEELIGSVVDAGKVVGVYRMENIDEDPNEVIVNQRYDEKIKGSYAFSYEVEDYVLVEGREPEKENECLVSIYNSLNVGDSFGGYKIVGRYNAKTQMLRAGALLSTSAVSIDSYTTKAFIIEDEEAFLTRLTDTYTVRTMYDAELYSLKSENERIMTVYLLLGIVCLAATSVLVFFLMRSRMVNDIYSIGVYRSLGSSKRKIYLKYLTDTLVMVTFTSLITYTLVTVGYLTAIESINDYFVTDLFSRSLTVPLLGVAVLYAVNLIFGLSPIVSLLRKTPSEILAKYDI